MDARDARTGQQSDLKRNQDAPSRANQELAPSMDALLAEWPARPRLAAEEMIAKYGMPHEMTLERLLWHDQGPYRRIMVTREEIPHDFPKPHMDFLEHTIEFDVPAEKASEVITFDGSVTINRTAGEVSARCDLEGHNLLTLNLVRDIVEKNKSADKARREFGEIVLQDVMGAHPEYVEKLQFHPTGPAARFPDQPIIPGSPERSADRATGGKALAMNDPQVLAFMVALDENEVLAAAEASKKNLRPEVLKYARMLHQEHGKNAGVTMKLGQKLGLTPLDTPDVDALRVEGAGKLAQLIPMDGEAFSDAFLQAVVKGHAGTVDLIDRKLLANTNNADLKRHLEQSRKEIAAQREQALTLQESSRV